MDEDTKELIIGLQAQISVLAGILVAHKLITEEQIKVLNDNSHIEARKELWDKL